MLGEAMAHCDSASRRITELEDEREIFALAGEESLHPFVYERRLRVIDEETERWREDLQAWGAAVWEMAAGEAEEAELSAGASDADSFDETFGELCRIDGIDAAEQLDGVRTAGQLMLDDLRARREMLEM